MFDRQSPVSHDDSGGISIEFPSSCVCIAIIRLSGLAGHLTFRLRTISYSTNSPAHVTSVLSATTTALLCTNGLVVG